MDNSVHDEANRLAQACSSHQEQLVVLTLLDTGPRVSELAGLTKDHLDLQMHTLMIYGKGGPYGTKIEAPHYSTITSSPTATLRTFSIA